jgi:hypothetical protein
MPRYEIDNNIQRHPEDTDVNVGQVLHWKVLKSDVAPVAEPDLVVHYGVNFVLDSRHQRFPRERVNEAIRELKRITGG